MPCKHLGSMLKCVHTTRDLRLCTALKRFVLSSPQSRIQGFGGSSSKSVSSASLQGGNNAASSSSSSRMTGFGNPRFESVNKKSSGVGGMNVTSPKALLGAISNAAGFSNPTRQQLERSLSQEKVRLPVLCCRPLYFSYRPFSLPGVAPSQHPAECRVVTAVAMTLVTIHCRLMRMGVKMIGHQATSPAPSAWDSPAPTLPTALHN